MLAESCNILHGAMYLYNSTIGVFCVEILCRNKRNFRFIPAKNVNSSLFN